MIVAGLVTAELPYSNMTVARRFRGRLTGLVGIGCAFCSVAGGEATPAASGAQEFRARARPQPSEGDPPLSDRDGRHGVDTATECALGLEEG